MSNDSEKEGGLKVGEERIILFVKGPYYRDDRDCKFAADFFSHRFMFMLQKKNTPNKSVQAINMQNKKPILEEYGIHSTVNLPYLLHDVFMGYKDATSERKAMYEKIYEEDDPAKIEIYLEDKFRPQLRTKNPRAYKVQQDVFHKFILYLNTKKDDPGEVSKLKTLMEELKKIDDFLSQNGYRFLTEDRITLPDCQLLPKLYQIEIAGKYYKQFEIPDDLAGLKRYIEAGKLEDAFYKTAPSEKEIIKALEKHLPPDQKLNKRPFK